MFVVWVSDNKMPGSVEVIGTLLITWFVLHGLSTSFETDRFANAFVSITVILKRINKATKTGILSKSETVKVTRISWWIWLRTQKTYTY